MGNNILILDFGGQYTFLIARRIREAGVYCEILPYNIPLSEIIKMNPKGIIFSGGPSSVYENNAPKISKEIFNLKIPILGICYGMQMIAYLLGGKVLKSDKREYGFNRIKILKNSILLSGVKDNSKIWMSHQDVVEKLPEGFEITSVTEYSKIASFEKGNIYGVQFHPEVSHTIEGMKIFKNFLFKICGCEKNWETKKIIEKIISDVQDKAKDSRVVTAVSGGVDSTIMAYLLYKALGKNFYGIFINNGLLRLGEEEEVLHNLKNRLGLPVKYINASNIFLKKLKGVIDPERKRRIIGDTFVEIFFKEFKKGDLLAQGTLYPDVIESVSVFGPSSKIKTHHNRVKKILDLMAKGRVIEPFKFLFKDEVRAIGKSLGIPDDIIYRMPFPGPGLAVRILGEVTKEKLRILRQADAIVREEIKNNCDIKKIWQAFAVLLPVRAVGVMGDARTYKNVVAVRIVESKDGMTADWVRLKYEILNKISNRIINEVQEINRVVYDISSKPPSTIEWE